MVNYRGVYIDPSWFIDKLIDTKKLVYIINVLKVVISGLLGLLLVRIKFNQNSSSHKSCTISSAKIRIASLSFRKVYWIETTNAASCTKLLRTSEISSIPGHDECREISGSNDSVCDRFDLSSTVSIWFFSRGTPKIDFITPVFFYILNGNINLNIQNAFIFQISECVTAVSPASWPSSVLASRTIASFPVFLS